MSDALMALACAVGLVSGVYLWAFVIVPFETWLTRKLGLDAEMFPTERLTRRVARYVRGGR